MATTGKNEPCPCGSGQSYEECCFIRDVLPAGRMDAKAFSRSVLEILENRQFESHEEAQAFIDKLTHARNSSPLEDFSGISPEHMYRFLHYPFDSPGLIDYNLEITRFPDAPFFRLFSYLLQGVVNDDLKATALGNLPQKFVQAAAPWFYDEEEYAKMRRYMTFRTETDFMELHTVRLTAEMAGFVRKFKGRFRATKAGRAIVEQGMNGTAFFALFQAYTRKFNWAYNDRYPDLPMIQEAFLFSLYLLRKQGSVLQPASYYADLFLKAFPFALEETPEYSFTSREETLLPCYAVRTLGRFALFFGFVAIDGDDHARWIEKRSLKKTPFLDEWLRFSIP